MSTKRGILKSLLATIGTLFIAAFATGSHASIVSAGGGHSCAVVNGGVQCWGFNGSGQLGNNSIAAQSLVPVQAIAPGSNATAVSAGGDHTCAVVNGGVQCWGLNVTGQLGNNSTTLSLVPVQAIAALSNVTAVSAGGFHSCAVVNGGVQCWGQNGGKLGNNSTAQSLVPVQAIAALSNVTAVSAGGEHSCAVVNGGVQCWGQNTNGPLGNNSTTNSLVPVQAVAALSNATAVSAGSAHSCAVVNGGVQCWGLSATGQLGNNSTTQSLVPVQTIAALSSVTAVEAGSGHSCAVVNGGVQCWGDNSVGQLGNNSTTQSLVPVQTIAALSNVTAVGAGASHSCAAVNGGLQCWGNNTNGHLGNNSTTQSLVPVAVLIISVPGAPTAVTAVAGISSAVINYTPPASDGGTPIFTYTAISNPGGITGNATGGPILVTGLTNGTAYTFTVTATNAVGVGPPSAASNSVTPMLAGSVCQFNQTSGAWTTPANWNNCGTGNGVPAGTPGPADRAEINAGTAILPAGTFNVGDIYMVNGTIQGAGIGATTLNIVAGGTIAGGSGTYTFQNLAVTIAAPVPMFAISGPWVMNSATINLLVGTTLNLADLTITGAGARFNNGGFFFPTGTLTATTSGVFENTSAGVFVPAAPMTINGTFINNGAFLTNLPHPITLTNAAGFSQPASSGFIGGDGTLSAVGQTLTIAAGFIGGDATFDVGTLNNTGAVVSPGGVATIGVITVNGNYTVNAAGGLDIEIAAGSPSTVFDQLIVSGNTTITGSAVDFFYFDDGFGIYVPAISDAHNFLVTGTRTGTFATFTAPISANAVSLAYFVNGVDFVVTAAAPAVTVTGTTTFPATTVGSSSAVQAITITNSGTGTLTLSLITASNVNLFFDTTSGPAPNAAHWCGFGSAVGGAPNTGAPINIAPGGTCVINVVFRPNAVGGLSSSIIINSNAPTSPTTITLNGTGLAAAGPTMTVAFAPGSVNTGVNATLTVSITNPAASPASISLGSAVSVPGLTLTSLTDSCSIGAFISTSSIDLGMGGAIPAMGMCTITVQAQSAMAGLFPVTVTPGNLVTSQGNNANTSTTTLTVTAVATGPFAYIPNFGSFSGTTVSVIDLPTNTVAATIPVGVGPLGAAVNTAGTRAYIANQQGNSVSVVNTATNTVIATVPVGSQPAALAVNPAGTRVYVPNQTSNSLSVIDTSTNSVIATVTGLSLPVGAGVNPAGGKVYVANNGTNNVAIIDTGTNTILTNVPVCSSPYQPVVNSAGTRVYVTCTSNAVAVIDTATATVVATIPVAGTPRGIALNPSGTRAYTSNTGGNSFSVIDTGTNTVIATVPAGSGPWGLAVNAAGTRLYVANSGSNNVSVVDTATNAVVATVGVGVGPVALGQFVQPAPVTPNPAVSLSPSSVLFGTRTVNITSPVSSVTLTNSGTANLIITAITGSGDFGFTTTCPISTPPIAAAGNCAINITFTPLTVAALTGTITITSNAPGSPHVIALSGTGSAVAVPNVTIAASTLNFGNQPLNSSSALQSIAVTNSGFATLLISGITKTGSSAFTRISPASISPDCATSLAPGATCFVTVIFTPAALGAATAQIDIASNASGSPHIVNLTGTGVAASTPGISVPGGVAFGDQIVNETSTQVLNIVSSGSVALNVSSIVLSGTDAASFATSGTCASIGAGATCAITISFTPRSTGAKAADLTIVSDAAAASTVTIQLSGNGILAPRPILSLTTTAIGFGNAIFGGATASQLVTVSNSGGASMQIQSLFTAGDFAQMNSCPAVLASSASCLINVLFTPRATGGRTGELVLITNADSNPRRIPLSGAGCRWFSQAQSRLFITVCG